MNILRVSLVIFIVVWCIALPFMADPLVGSFRLSLSDPLHLDTGGAGYALVFKKDQQITKTFPLEEVNLGWSGIQSAFHFVGLGILLGILIGFPFGELSTRMLTAGQASEEAIREGQRLKFDASIEMLSAERMIKNAKALCFDYPQLKKKIAENQKTIFMIHESKRELLTNYQKIEQQLESVEKELVKAKGKIRRLEGQIERVKDQKQLT